MTMQANTECRLCGMEITENVILVNDITNNSDFYFYYCMDCDALTSQPFNRENIYCRSEENTNFTPKRNIIVNTLKSLFVKFSIKRLLSNVSSGAKILDYGCGNGDVANNSKSLGYQTYAYDVQCDRPDTLLSEIPYFSSENFSQGPDCYDVIILRHVLEHVPNPIQTIKMLATRLSDEGFMIVEVPNLNSIHRKYMGKRWTGYFAPYHEVVLSETAFLKISKSLNLKCETRLKEPFIFGVFLMQFGLPRGPARICSLLLYPFQIILSKMFQSGEAVECIIKK